MMILQLMGAKDIKDLKLLIEKQISGQYLQALNAITKKEILDQIIKIISRFTSKQSTKKFYYDSKS